MRQKVYILYNDITKYIAERIASNVSGKLIYSKDFALTEENLIEMANDCGSRYFYTIKTDTEITFPNFDFSFKPDPWDKDYVHIWNNDSKVRIYNADNVLSNPSQYTDSALENGIINIKSIPGRIYSYPVFDIIFLSYDEPEADEHFERLKARFSYAKRLHNIKGIFEAHKAAAEWAAYDKSDMFYVVDADAEILPTFNFDYQPNAYDRQSVHVWHSRNPVNDLEYGYGGIKLFPTQLLIEYTGSPVDFTTTVSKSFKVIPEVSNITRFNTDPFSAWRSAFRECAKLAARVISNQEDTETTKRLVDWCNKGADREFGDFAIMGAIAGRKFGYLHKDQPDMLRLINDFSWLEKQFNS